MKGNNKIFKRLASCCIINQFLKEYENIHQKIGLFRHITNNTYNNNKQDPSPIYNVSSTFYNALHELVNYVDKFEGETEPQLEKDVIEIAERKQAFDLLIHHDYLLVKKEKQVLHSIDLFLSIAHRMYDYYYYDKLIVIFNSLIRYHKYRARLSKSK